MNENETRDELDEIDLTLEEIENPVEQTFLDIGPFMRKAAQYLRISMRREKNVPFCLNKMHKVHTQEDLKNNFLYTILGMTKISHSKLVVKIICY